MAKIVVLSWCQYSISFQTKVITLNNGETATLGRRDAKDCSRNNGLFDYPKHIKRCKVSRNHAQIDNTNSEVHLTACSSNTFINNRLVEKGSSSKMESGDVIILGGLEDVNVADSVICLLRIFSSGQKELKYFSLLTKEFPFYCRLPESPPNFTMDLEQMYSIVMDRLKVLADLTTFSETQLNATTSLQSVVNVLRSDSYAEMLSLESYHQNYEEEYEFMRNDYVSQYLLALACSRTNRLKYWFIQQERKLFILRWFKMFSQEKIDFLNAYELIYAEVAHHEIEPLRSLHPHFFPIALKYYKVPFTEVPTLIKKRRIYVNNGLCYISVEDMFAPAVERFDKMWWTILKEMKKNINRIWRDDRIRSLIRYVEITVQSSDRYQSDKRRGVSENHIGVLCNDSFPLCMKILQYRLSRDHHLKNGGRFQYTLFLKGIGLKLPSAVNFWRTHFTKKMSSAEFLKKYGYHIHHAYGSVGKMADYPPQSCAEILKAVPGTFEYHGCPFKLLDEDRLGDLLRRSGIQSCDYDKIFEQVRVGTPQLACGKYFELTHGEKYPNQSVKHPNIYYDESRKERACQKKRLKMQIKESKASSGIEPRRAALCQSKQLDW